MDKLLRSTFSTEALRESQTVNEHEVQDAWTEAMSVFFKPHKLTDDRLIDKLGISDTTSGVIDNFLFPGMMSIKVAASGHRFSRTEQDIAQDGIDGILIQYWKGGQLIAPQRGSHVEQARSGDIHLVDFSREVNAISSDFETYNLLLPRELLSSLGNIDELHLKRLSGTHTLARLLRRHMYALHQEAAHMTAQEGQALIEPTLALIKAALSSSLDAQEEASQIIDRNILLEIKQFIDTHLSNPKLNPNMIAAELGLSRTRLYRLTEPLGGLQNFIRNRRLRRAFQILATKGHEIKSLTTLAYEQGFQSEDTFRRAFKNAFGMTPSEAKEQGLKAYSEYYASLSKEETKMPMGDRLYQEWVSNLFS